jgi:membrane protein implicated in regulation of membrane protease activity
MCHVILLMPVAALPVFWLLPARFSVPIYIVIVVISGLFYRAISRSMMKPVTTGAEAMIGGSAMVLQRTGKKGGHYLVRAGSELWTALGTDDLRPGDRVLITDMDGIRLVVAPPEAGSGSKESRLRERHCH